MLNFITRLAADAETQPEFTFETILWPVLIMLGVALVFGILLTYLSKVLAVEEDPRIAEINAKLAGANCGACGFPGCGGYAAALVAGTAEPNKCGGADNVAIAGILGVAAAEPTKVMVNCVGGNNAGEKYTYRGYTDCASNSITFGGKKLCAEGCVGFGSCHEVCPEKAITIGENGYAEVNQDKCINCGLCIAACPKGIIKRIPKVAKVQVACSSTCLMKEAKARGCDKGCIKCGKCEKACPAEAIKLQGNVPVIDYSKCAGCGLCADACPKQVIKKV